MLEPNGVVIQGFILLTGIIGQFYVAHMNKSGFYWWLGSNAALIFVSIKFGSYGQAVLYLFFSAMCFYSIYQWETRQGINKSTYLDLSTCHLSKDTIDRLPELGETSFFTVATYDEGAFISVPSLDNLADMPSDLVNLMRYAADNGYSVIRIDSDAPIINGLPTFKW